MLSGYKTYLVAALGAIYALSAYFTGHVDTNMFVQLLQTSLGLGALRSAISS
jgi:uncharacterized membrane protein YphA (DoxX/SURF4 family)